jgi:sigma-B regulation protein RsbU (phosphoserine phosphatase)
MQMLNGETVILIVDDEPDVEILMKQRFRKELREKKFAFMFAHNGIEALDILSKNSIIRLVISDINMPEMDGLTLLRKINESFPAVIPIIVSAYGDMNNIRAAMNLGAFDFVTKPINFEDLTVTIDKTLIHIQNLINAQRTKSRLDGILHELNVASEIQQSILPKNFIHDEQVEIFAKMIPAKEVGGDFYDFFWLDEDKNLLALVIADVSGKGVAAALFMTVTRTLLSAHAYNNIEHTAHCLQKVNNALFKNNENMMFVTAFYGILDVRTGNLKFTNAGHNPPLIRRSDNKIEKILQKHGMPLAIEGETPYKEDSITLNPGDTLFMYTDGVTEAESASGSFYGETRLADALNQYGNLAASEIVNTIRTDINTFVAGYPQSDDITMLAVRFLARKQN